MRNRRAGLAAHEALEQEHSGCAAWMARAAQIEAQAEAGYGWTPGQAESSSAEADYDNEIES